MSDTKNVNSESDNGGRKPLSVSRGKDSGTVKQSFSHGRSKQVVVEKKKKRITPAGGKPTKTSGGSSAKPAGKGKPEVSKEVELAKKLGITVAELKARQAALKKQKEEDSKRKAEKEAQAEASRRLKEEQNRIAQEEREREEAEARKKAEEEARKQAEEEAARVAKEESERARAAKTDKKPVQSRKPEPEPAPPADPDGGALAALGGRVKRAKEQAPPPAKPSRSRGEPKRRQGKLTITAALDGDEDRQRSLASVKS